MGKAFLAIACIGLYLIFCLVVPADSTSTPLVGFVGIGYDLLKGNPEGDFNQGGIDPGYKLARNILKRTYTKNKEASFNGKTIKIPDQMAYHPVSSCSSVESISVYTGTKSYRKKLDINIEAAAEGSYGLFEYRFSLSKGYSDARAVSVTSKQVIMDKTVICNEGEVRYLTSTALNTNHSISADFFYAVKDLPPTYDQSKYIEFIKDWGTHFIEGVTVGGRLITRFKSSYIDTYKYASENLQSSISAGGSYGGYSGSFKVDINTFSERMSHTLNFGSNLGTVNSGSRIVKENNYWKVAADDSHVPIPIALKLEIITDAFQKGLWTITPDGSTYDSLQIGTKLQHLKKALTHYPSIAGAQVDSDDPVLVFPNAWPDGTYALPKTKFGCPSLGDRNKWSTGYIYQDNEDDGNDNQCPSPWVFSGHCDRNLGLDYCIKEFTNGDVGITWPKGSYCIVKKGDCPSSFSSGYVYWDDEDSGNENSVGGVRVSGSFGRNTRIDYCCRSDQHPSIEITLPTDKPFFLIRKHPDGCQRVKNRGVTELSIYTDDEDDGNANSEGGDYPYGVGGHNHRMYYCYYD